MENIGKRCLHALCGAIVGFCIGAFLFFFLPFGIIGAVIGGISAFFLADKFWEELREFINFS